VGQLETVEMETRNGKQKWKTESQNLMQMNARVKPLINDHPSVQRPPLCKDHIIIMSERQQMTEAYLIYLVTETTSVQRTPFNKVIYLFLNHHL